VLHGALPGVTLVVAGVSATGVPPTSRTRIDTERTLAGMYFGVRTFALLDVPGAGIVKEKVAEEVGPW
jgi:hypothetical protein